MTIADRLDLSFNLVLVGFCIRDHQIKSKQAIPVCDPLKLLALCFHFVGIDESSCPLLELLNDLNLLCNQAWVTEVSHLEHT